VPDRGGQGQDALHDPDPHSGRGVDAAANEVAVDRARVRERLRTLPSGMRSSTLKDALAEAMLELDAIAGPVLRMAPNGAPVTRASSPRLHVLAACILKGDRQMMFGACRNR
jgi:hypothetical protein